MYFTVVRGGGREIVYATDTTDHTPNCIKKYLLIPPTWKRVTLKLSLIPTEIIQYNSSILQNLRSNCRQYTCKNLRLNCHYYRYTKLEIKLSLLLRYKKRTNFLSYPPRLVIQVLIPKVGKHELLVNLASERMTAAPWVPATCDHCSQTSVRVNGYGF